MARAVSRDRRTRRGSIHFDMRGGRGLHDGCSWLFDVVRGQNLAVPFLGRMGRKQCAWRRRRRNTAIGAAPRQWCLWVWVGGKVGKHLTEVFIIAWKRNVCKQRLRMSWFHSSYALLGKTMIFHSHGKPLFSQHKTTDFVKP